MLFTRGPDAVLAKGTTIEMILDRQVRFAEDELDFTNVLPHRSYTGDGGGPLPSKKASRRPTADFPCKVKILKVLQAPLKFGAINTEW